jgi:hypothetical protein
LGIATASPEGLLARLNELHVNFCTNGKADPKIHKKLLETRDSQNNPEEGQGLKTHAS